MIIQGQTHQLQRSGLTGERQFGIALSAKMYSMVTDKLYTDRIGSVVREVCSNAWDGMKMKSLALGQPQEPFRVTLPTDLEPHFVVEDFGVGMPDAQAQDLYSTLGLSTKEGTNDQIGAFGLGSKSPFAVTDTFTVENTYEGVTHYYLCFKSEQGLPSLLKTGEKVEDRPNGVKVIIPAPGHKYRDYKAALNRQLIVMDPKPIICNLEDFTFTEPEWTLKNEFGGILANASEFGLQPQTLYARMGMVIYPIETSQIGMGYSSGIFRNFKNGGSLILEFHIGELEPLPSREGLSYDGDTVGNIKLQYRNFEKIYIKELKKQVEDKPTALDAWKEINNIRRSTGVDLMAHNVWVLGYQINNDRIDNAFPTFEHKYMGLPPLLEREFDEDGNEVPVDPIELSKKEAQFVFEVVDRRDTRLNIKRDIGKYEYSNFNQLSEIESGQYRFLIMDEAEPKYKIQRMKSVLESMPYGHYTAIVRVNPLFKGDHLDFSEFYASLERLHPGITKVAKIHKLSEIPRPEREKTVRTADEREIDGIRFSRKGWEQVVKWSEIEDMMAGEEGHENVPGNAFYVTAVRNELNEYRANMEDIIEFAHRHKFVVFIVRKSGMHLLKRLEGLGVPELKKFIPEKMQGYSPSEGYKKQSSAKDIINGNYLLYSRQSRNTIKVLLKRLREDGEYIHPFFTIWEDIINYAESEHTEDEQSRLIVSLKTYKLYNAFENQDWQQDFEVDLRPDFNGKLELFNKCYPQFNILMNYVNTYQDEVCPVKLQHIRDYNTLRGLNAQEIDFIEVNNSLII